MRLARRLVVAALLSTVFVALLTWAGWPRPRFVVPLPELHSYESVTSATWGGAGGLPLVRPGLGPTPWFGLRILGPAMARGEWPNDLWFVNLRDGRTDGPRDLGFVSHFDWDTAGRAVYSSCEGGRCAIRRYDPDTGRTTTVAPDRAAAFDISGNRATLLTLTAHGNPVSKPVVLPPGDLNFVCFDLTADPPTRTGIDFVLPGNAWAMPGGINFERNHAVHCALSPDGRTLAVVEGSGWPTVKFFDTRSGHAIGPPVTANLLDFVPIPHDPGDGSGHPPVYTNRGNLFRQYFANVTDYRLEFTPDSKFLSVQGMTLDMFGGVATVPPPPPPPPPLRFAVPPGPRADDPPAVGSLPRFETEPTPAARDFFVIQPGTPVTDWLARFRVVGPAGEPLTDWRVPDARHAPLFGLGGDSSFVGETTGCVTLAETPEGPLARLFRQARRRLGLVVREPTRSVLWYDWAADDFRTVTEAYSPATARPAQLHADTSRFALVTFAPTGQGTVEVWDAPPPRKPWAWSVPAGVALGLLATVAGIAARRGRGL